MTHHNNISLYLFFIFVFYLFLKIESFTPTGRLAHSSVLVGNKLYFFGGDRGDDTCSNEVLYLDASQPFNIASPPWSDLTVNQGMPIKSCWGTASLSDTNNEQSIYLFGGITQDKITNESSSAPFAYKFNLKSGKWEAPIIMGKTPERRIQIDATSDSSGKIYIFGGHFSSFFPAAGVKFFSDMAIFNDAELSWSISYVSNAPTIAGYSATLLSNGIIVYIGGFTYNDGIQFADISQINLYDTKSLTWSVQKANIIGQIESRGAHTAVLAPGGKIIVYGGAKAVFKTNNIINFQVSPDIAVLNTETSPFEWTAPLVSSNIGVPSLMAHTADLVGNYMIVAFGNITRPNDHPTSVNANIYVMDIRNYTWINTFETTTPPNSSIPIPTPSTSIPTPSAINTQLIIIGTVSGFVGALVLMTIGIFGFKWYKNHQIEKQVGIIRIHGNNTK